MQLSKVEIAAGCYGLDGYGMGIAEHGVYADYGAVVLKSTSLHPIEGNTGQTFYDLGDGTFWNCVALRNPGIQDVVLPNLPNLRLSLYATNDDEWCDLIESANQLDVGSYELNLSCPAVATTTIQDYQRVLSASTKPVYLKHSWNNRLPFIPSGVAGVVCGNTLPFRGGGLSGNYCRAYNVRLAQALLERDFGYRLRWC